MPPDLVTIAEGVAYDPATHTLHIDGVEFSPIFLAQFTTADGEWRGPIWVRRQPLAGGGAAAEITTINPLATVREH